MHQVRPPRARGHRADVAAQAPRLALTGAAPDAARIVALTSRLVALPSHESEQEVQLLLASLLEETGFEVRLQEIEPGRPNLIASRGSGGPWFCSHADVHPPHGHPDPWKCRQEDGLLVGRGVVDTKGQLASLLDALASEPDTAATVVVCCDEESGGLGSQRLDLPESLRPAEGGIVLEPTGLGVSVAQSGCIDLEIRIDREPRHMAVGGVSAADELLRILELLRAECSFLRHTNPLVPPPRVHLGVLQAGEHLWRTPATAAAQVSLTLLPQVDAAEARGELEAVLSTELGESGKGSYRVIDVCEPIQVPQDLPVVSRLREAMGRGFRLTGMPSWTDATHLLLRHGIPCVVFGAGDLDSAHSDREWVRVRDLVDLSSILRRVLRSY
ncbi:MAG TPA: M20/M25/M40 family metallo-hydrolase [Actinomycetota bacterium]|nr:M20/M25/M40 family metallo-hydrolase [Actinomycetota bacterium]